MTEEGPPAPPDGRAADGAAGSRSGAAAPGTLPARTAPSRADRILLGALGVYAALLAVAAFAQLTDNRALLDLFDFRRFFTR